MFVAPCQPNMVTFPLFGRAPSILGRISRSSRLWGLAVAAVVACAPSAAPPNVAPNADAPTLGPRAEGKGAASEGPFRVVFAGPEGAVGGAAQISIVFNRAVQTLSVADEGTAPPFTISPNIEGAFQPVGTSAYLFAPRGGALLPATEYRVTVPGNYRAVSGEVLGQPYTFTFTTPRPAIVRTNPWNGETGLAPSTRFEVDFNQPMDRAEVANRVKLLVPGAGKRPERTIAASVEQPDPKNERHFVLVPKSPLPAATSLELRVDPDLRGKLGTLSGGEVQALRFETYGRLAVTTLGCSQPHDGAPCAPRGGFWLTLSNPVRYGDLKRSLRVEPSVALSWPSWAEDADEVAYFDLGGAFEPGTTYTVEVKGTLTDTFRQTLGANYRGKLVIGDHPARVEVGVSGEYFEPEDGRPIPIGSVNVRDYRLTASAVRRDALERYLVNRDDQARERELLGGLRTKPRVVRPSGPKNGLWTENVRVEELLGDKAGRGSVLVRIDYTADGDARSESRLLQVTDLGISAKLSRDDSSVVWVTSLSTGAPVAGAKVMILTPSGRGQSFVTNADGIASLPPGALRDATGENASHSAVFVEKDRDFSYRKVGDYLDPWRARVPTDAFGAPVEHGLLFTDRGLYRPGDKVLVKGILRSEAKTGNTLLSNQDVTVVVRSPDWELMREEVVHTTPFGTFSFELTTPLTAALGQYRVEVKELERHGYAATGFELAEYRPTEIAAKVSSSAPSFEQGERARFEVAGDYLFGAPMGGAEVHFRATRSETWWSVPGRESLVFDSSAYDSAHPERAPSSGLLTSGEAKLDAKGRFVETVPLELPGQRGPELVSFDAEVQDVSRQVAASSSTAVVHPSDAYVGLERLDPYFVASPGTLEPRALVTTPDGKPLVGRSVKLELFRRRWNLVRETSGDTAHSEMRVEDKSVATCSFTSQTKVGSCKLALSEPGYYVVLATTKDRKGRASRSAVDAYALGSGASFWQDDDAGSLELVADKPKYKVGDVARILVKSPFRTAEALVTVEGMSVRSERRIRLDGPTPTITVPITEDLRPNAYVAVHLVRPRTSPPTSGSGADIGAPTYRTGHAELVVDPEARRLSVTLEPNKTAYGPAEEVDLGLTVTDRSGRGAISEVTVYAVDEGVLSLIGYKVPDPVPVFTASRPLRTATLESRSALARIDSDLFGLLGIGANKGASGGGGGDESGSGVRRDFRASAYFNPVVLTGKDGKARVKFKLPESLTTYRLMAVATTEDDRYGFSERRVTTSKPLMARPALPRILRAGDRFDASLIVSSKGLGPASVKVTLDAKGLDLLGNEEQLVELPKDGSIEVRFPAHARVVGTARLRFDVRGQAGGVLATDAVELDRKVLLPAALETVALYGKTETASAEALGSLENVRKDVGGLELQASSTALVGLDAGFEQLLEYPYACSEQLASRILPLLSLRDIAEDFGVSMPSDPKRFIASTIAELLKRQRGDGGFALWPESSESHRWVSPYVLFTLADARARGHEVPSDVLARGGEYLRRELARAAEPMGLAARAFAVDVLALLGTPDAGYTNGLFLERKQLPAFSRALLLHAMAVSGQPKGDVETLTRELENQLRVEGNRAYFAENLGDEYAVLLDSPARTTALVLRALVAARPDHPLGAKLARGLLDARDGSSWRSTQETAFSLIALDAYRQAQEKVTPSFVARLWSSTEKLFETRFDGRSLASKSASIPMERLHPGRLTFEKQGTGTLFYEARLRYAKTELPADSLDRGFFVQRAYRPTTPSDLEGALGWVPRSGATKFPAGGLVIVDLLVVTPSPRYFTVVDDPLPAGLEPVDSSLATSAAWTNVSGSVADDAPFPSDDALARRDAFMPSDYRSELRDDRAVFFIEHLAAGMYHYRYLARATTRGTFIVPPTRAEEMYAPEVFGRTRGEVVTVE